MNFIKINKEEYEVNYKNFVDQYVVINNNLIYNGNIVGKVDIKIRKHAPMPYPFSILQVNSNSSLAGIIQTKVEEQRQEMDLEGTILIEEEEF